MSSTITNKTPSTNDDNIELGKRRVKRPLQIVGAAGLLCTLGSFTSFNNLIAPLLIDLSFSQGLFNLMIGLEEMIGPIRVLWVFLFGALFLSGWAIGYKERKEAQARIDAINSMKDLQNMDWRQFEEILADYYLLRNYRVTLVGGSGGGGDGGIDLIIRKGVKKYIVQAKHYKNNVGVSIVREMYGVMHDQKAQGVIICTTADFTADGYAFANKKPIFLVGGEALFSMFMRVNSKAKKNK